MISIDTILEANVVPDPLIRLGIRRLDVWLWRERPMAEIYAECRGRGMLINSTFDGDCGNLVDATDHERCLAAWAYCRERLP